MNDNQFQQFWECFNTLKLYYTAGVILPRDQEPTIRKAIYDRYGQTFHDGPVVFMGVKIIFV